MCVGQSALAQCARMLGGIPVPLSTSCRRPSGLQAYHQEYYHSAPSPLWSPRTCNPPWFPHTYPCWRRWKALLVTCAALYKVLVYKNDRAARCAAPISLSRPIHHNAPYDHPSPCSPCPQSSAPCPRCWCTMTHSPSCNSCGRRPAGSWRSAPTASGPTERGKPTTPHSMTWQRCGDRLQLRVVAKLPRPVTPCMSTPGVRAGTQGLGSIRCCGACRTCDVQVRPLLDMMARLDAERVAGWLRQGAEQLQAAAAAAAGGGAAGAGADPPPLPQQVRTRCVAVFSVCTGTERPWVCYASYNVFMPHTALFRAGQLTCWHAPVVRMF